MSGRQIIEGLKAAVEYTKGNATGARETIVHVPAIDVRAIRRKLGLSQTEFALRFGFSLGTVRHWEQGQRYPEGAARVLLLVIEHNPEAVTAALAKPTNRAKRIAQPLRATG